MRWFKIVLLFFLCFMIFGRCTINRSKTQNSNSIEQRQTALTGKELFIQWGRENYTSFDFNRRNTLDRLVKKIADDIADSRVVMLSEGFHNCEEMLRLQYELISYLVSKKGFRVIATESGLPESKYLNDYIHGKDSIPNLWKKSIDILYSEWKTVRATIQWLLDYNQSHANQVDYIGADIGGFYQDWEFPFQQIFSYLDTVDTSAFQKLKKDMASYFEIMKPYAAYYYVTKLTPEQKNRLVIILDELIQTFTLNKKSYIEKSGKDDYIWILQCVKSMRMAEHYYRNYKNVRDTTANKVPIYLGANGREMAMAENIKWMLSYKKNAKIIVINHVLHTKTASQYQGEFYKHFTPMGQLLKQHLKEDLFIIGMVYGKGQFWNKWQTRSTRVVDTIPPPDTNGLESVMQAISTENYYLRTEDPPLLTYSWFQSNTTIRENDYKIKIKPSEWNACFYLHEVTPAKAAE